MQLHTLFPSLSKSPTNHCQEKSFRESIDQLPLYGREQLQVISLQLLSMSCAGWFLCSTSLLSNSCPFAGKAVSFRKIIDLTEVQRDGEMTAVGFFVWFWVFFFQRNSHSYAVTQHPWKTLVLQGSSPGHCCSLGSVKGRGWGLAGKGSQGQLSQAKGKAQVKHKVCMYLVTGSPST